MWARSGRLVKMPLQRPGHPLALREEMPEPEPAVPPPVTDEPDPQQEAEEILRQAGAEMAAAREEAQALRRTAGEEGHREGLEQGRREAEALLAEARRDAEAMREQARQESQRLAEEGEGVVLELAVATAERILRRELTTDPQVFLPAIHAALEMLGAVRDARLKVPQAVAWAFADALGEVTVEGDPHLGRDDGFHLEGPGMAVDGRISRQVERLRPALAEALQGGWRDG